MYKILIFFYNEESQYFLLYYRRYSCSMHIESTLTIPLALDDGLHSNGGDLGVSSIRITSKEIPYLERVKYFYLTFYNTILTTYIIRCIIWS